MINDIVKVTSSALNVMNARVDAYARRSTLRQVNDLSRKALMVAEADLAQAAIERWLEVLYDVHDGVLCNVDSSGVVLVPPPWSRTRHNDYGINSSQAVILLRVVKLYSQIPKRMRPYFYNIDTQRWHLNLVGFPTLQSALQWQQSTALISAKTWNAEREKVRLERAQKRNAF